MKIPRILFSLVLFYTFSVLYFSISLMHILARQFFIWKIIFHDESAINFYVIIFIMKT